MQQLFLASSTGSAFQMATTHSASGSAMTISGPSDSPSPPPLRYIIVGPKPRLLTRDLQPHLLLTMGLSPLLQMYWILLNLEGLVVSVVNRQPGETIIDCCAAPGGKTLFMASYLRGQAWFRTQVFVQRKMFSCAPCAGKLLIHNISDA
ncbi:hypothetical protein MRB53_023237 [Persea americana]|uniref:Uncharacterized protein n=1 Tax=Persea americana TaxID=3435 RepID=A0ACC2L8X8_PERAE|nr:hypothetical protein MRB53_023237 [Persea americana]